MKETLKDGTIIDVEYTGRYPVLCFGYIIIKLNDKQIYETEIYSFYSTGTLDDDYEPTEGKLKFKDEALAAFKKWLKDQFYAKDIKRLVFEELDNQCPCCGGCS